MPGGRKQCVDRLNLPKAKSIALKKKERERKESCSVARHNQYLESIALRDEAL